MTLTEKLISFYVSVNFCYVMFAVWRDLKNLKREAGIELGNMYRVQAEKRASELGFLLVSGKPFTLDGKRYRVEQVEPEVKP